MKYCGNIGFMSSETQIEDGVAIQPIIDKKYYGEVIRTSSRLQTQGKVNPDFTLNNSISILLDGYLKDNLYSIVYVEFLNHKWAVSTVEIQHPRVLITLGGLYNG